jgi:hypothetical protein
MAGPGRDDDHDEEVRFAVVLNGGVSLAIWMVRVAYAIHRLTRTRPAALPNAHVFREDMPGLETGQTVSPCKSQHGLVPAGPAVGKGAPCSGSMNSSPDVLRGG